MFIQVSNHVISACTDPSGRVPGREHQVQQRSDVLLRGPVGLLRAGLCLGTQSVPGRLQTAWWGPEDWQADGEVRCSISRVQPGVRTTSDFLLKYKKYQGLERFIGACQIAPEFPLIKNRTNIQPVQLLTVACVCPLLQTDSVCQCRHCLRAGLLHYYANHRPAQSSGENCSCPVTVITICGPLCHRGCNCVLSLCNIC